MDVRLVDRVAAGFLPRSSPRKWRVHAKSPRDVDDAREYHGWTLKPLSDAGDKKERSYPGAFIIVIASFHAITSFRF